HGRTSHCRILAKWPLTQPCAWLTIVTLDPCTGIEIVEDHRRLSTRSLEAAMPLPWMGSTTGKSLAPLPGTLKAGSVAKRFKVSESSCLCWRCWANSNSWRTSASLIRSIMCCSNSLTEFMTKISTDQPWHADQPQETFFLSQPATGRGAGRHGLTYIAQRRRFTCAVQVLLGPQRLPLPHLHLRQRRFRLGQPEHHV